MSQQKLQQNSIQNNCCSSYLGGINTLFNEYAYHSHTNMNEQHC